MPVSRSVSRRTFLKCAGSSLVLGACGEGYEGASLTTPDLILSNANIWTGDDARPRAQAISFSGNRIQSLGPGDALRRHATPGTKVVDVGGKFVMPGFNDSHVHFSRLAADINNVALLRARNIGDILDLVRDRVKDMEAGEWILGSAQWHETLLAEGRMPTRQELDSVAPHNPVYIPRGGHVAVVNSEALRIAGINSDTPNPPGGIIVRDTTGAPGGVLLETAKTLVARHLPSLSQDSLRAAMAKQLQELSSLGITSLTNPGISIDHLETLTDLFKEQSSSIRINWTVGGYGSVGEIVSGYPLEETTKYLHYNGLGEIGVDGGIEGAYLREPYEIVPGVQESLGYRGIVSVRASDVRKFEEFYLQAIDAGYTVMTHVTGDAGLDIALEVLGKVKKKKPFDHLRWNLHGCFLVDDAQLEKIRRLGLYITAQIQPYLLGWQMVKWWGRERANRSIPFRAFLDAGIPVAAGSDASAGIENPLEAIGWIVNRTCLGGLQLDRKWGVTAEEALRLYTRGSAETQFVEDKLGSLREGMLADVVILDEDPTAVSNEEIYNIKVDATIMNGRPVFDRKGFFS